MRVLIKQDIKNLFSNSVTILFCSIYPLALTLLFGFLFSSQYGEMVSSYDFYGIAMMYYIVLAASTITPITFMEKRLQKGNERIAYAPVSKVQIYGSKLLATYLFTAGFFILDILVLQGIHLVSFGSGVYFWLVLLLYLVLLFFTISFGGAICTIIQNQDLTNKIIGAVLNTLAIFSGIFFPISNLGTWADSISNAIPLKWLLNTIFQIIYDQSIQGYLGIVAITMLLGGICIGIIHKKYKVIS